MIRIFCLSILLLPALLSAQLQEARFARWHVRVGGGFSVPLQQIETGFLSDKLVNFGYASPVLIPLSASYFFNAEWGLEAHVLGLARTQRTDRTLEVFDEVNVLYGNDYYTDVLSRRSFTSNPSFQVGLGVVHQWRSGRWSSRQHVGVGLRQVGMDNVSVSMKAHGTNYWYELEIFTNGEKTVPVLTATLAGSYELFDRLLLNGELHFSRFDPNLMVAERFRNQFTDIGSVKMIRYNQPISTLAFVIGCSYLIDLDSPVPRNLQLP